MRLKAFMVFPTISIVYGNGRKGVLFLWLHWAWKIYSKEITYEDKMKYLMKQDRKLRKDKSELPF